MQSKQHVLAFIVLVTCLHGAQPASSSVMVQTTPSDEVDAGECSHALVQCRVDFSKTDQSRANLLVLRKCITGAPCESDEDVEQRDKLLFTVNSNFFHFIPEDDERRNEARWSTSSSVFTLTFTQVLLAKLVLR